MSKIEEIIELYYVEHLKLKDIATKLNISSSYINKIIKDDVRYIEEKAYRKEMSNANRKTYQKNLMKNKREQKKIEDNYSTVLTQHYQASIELSKRRTMSNESFRRWNSSAYKYNPSKNRYEFDERLGRAFDVPKYVKGGI